MNRVTDDWLAVTENNSGLDPESHASIHAVNNELFPHTAWRNCYCSLDVSPIERDSWFYILASQTCLINLAWWTINNTIELICDGKLNGNITDFADDTALTYRVKQP